ncbi:sugar phosphate isomerase/epimerase [bacterium]|nr:sugar phosphate isomerase/epimerase [bacterium]
MLRRHFIHALLASLAAKSLADHHGAHKENPESLFKISLAQWSNHRALRKGDFTNMEWPEYTKKTFNILGLEYVNQFFKDKAKDMTYLGELKKRVSDLGMENVLIMIDGEGHLGADSDEKRQKTVDQHKKWVEAAKFLGCHSIRVNSHGEGATDDEKALNCVKGLTALTTFAQDHHINVIVENHGGLSSNGEWMAKVLADVGLDECGSLPDFGNFHDYDRYKGLKELMPFAKGVSAKSHDFDDKGEETKTDFRKALKIVMDQKFHGWIGVEYEGKTLSEVDGIKATKALLEKVRAEMA